MSAGAFRSFNTPQSAAIGRRLPEALASPRDHPLAGILRAGNRATRLAVDLTARKTPVIQRKCACGGGNDSACRCDEQNESDPLRVQPSLVVNEPGDRYEQEADRVAEQVMRTPAGGATTVSTERISALQPTGRASERTGITTNGLAVRLAGASTQGVPLEAGVRATFEPHFGPDLGAVRIHTGVGAAELSDHLNATAFTHGRDVYFARGMFAPQTPNGRRLLAHELTHVVQQTSGVAATDPQRIARQPKGTPGQGGGSPPPVLARYQVVETPLGGGRVSIRVWGTAGDPIARPGLEAKYPLPKDVGLPGYDRWHLAGPNATGVEEGIVYAPKNFNVSKTAQIENVVRNARTAVRGQGGEVYFDFTAEARVTGQYEGVEVRVLEKVTWEVEVRPAGTDKVIPIFKETATLPGVTPATPPPSRGRAGAPAETAPPSARAAAPEVPPATERPVVPIPEGKPAPMPEGAGGAPKGGGKWSGTAGGVMGFAIPIILGWVHAGAVEKRIEEQSKQEGYVPRGAPSGEGLLYDLGAWLLDPAGDAERAVGMDKRFNFPVWRQRVRNIANAKLPGETLRMSWDIGKCEFDFFGNQVVEEREIVYRKQPDGKWVVESADARGTPDLNDIVSPDFPDDRLKSIIMRDPCPRYSEWA